MPACTGVWSTTRDNSAGASRIPPIALFFGKALFLNGIRSGSAGAATLVGSLQGVGYRVWTAIADIIENSTSTHAEDVWVQFTWQDRDSWISILDGGRNAPNPNWPRDAIRAVRRSPFDAREPT